MILNQTDMSYKIATPQALAIRQPRHRAIKRDFLRIGSLSLVDPYQPSYQYLSWAYDSTWIRQYKLELSKLSDTSYQLKRKFTDLPAVTIAPWSPTVTCLQYTDETMVWYERGNIEFDNPTEEWAPDPLFSEWEDVTEYQSWSRPAFPRKRVSVRASAGFLAVYQLPPSGTYTLGELKELGYAELKYETVTSSITLQTAQKP